MPIDIEKSSTRKQPLRRGIHITEHKDYRVNPEPLVLQEADFLLEEFLSPTKLVNIYICAEFKYLLYSVCIESIDRHR